MSEEQDQPGGLRLSEGGTIRPSLKQPLEESIWSMPIDRRDAIPLIFIGGFAASVAMGDTIANLVRGIFSPRSSRPSKDRTNQLIIESGWATIEDERQRKRIEEQAQLLFGKFVNPALIPKYKRTKLQESFSLKDLHFRRSTRLPNSGYSWPMQMEFFDDTVAPERTLGISILLSFDQLEQLKSAEFHAFPGGLNVIQELATLGEIRPESNKLFERNFNYVPVTRLREAAYLIFNLPQDIIWKYIPSPYPDEGIILNGEFTLPDHTVGKVSFDFDGLPKLKASFTE